MKSSHPYIVLLLTLVACGPETEESVTTEATDSSNVIKTEVEDILLPAPDENPEFELFHEVRGHVVSFEVEDSNTIWIGSSKQGLFKVAGGEVETLNPRNSGIGHLVRAVHNDSKGNIWVTSSAPVDKISRYDGTAWTAYDPLENGFRYAPSRISEDNHGKLHFGSMTGVKTFENNFWDSMHLPLDSCAVAEISFNSIGDLAIWANQGGFMYIFVRRGGDWTIYPEDSPELALGNMNSLLIDEESNVFVGSWKGLAVLSDNHYEHYQGDDMQIEDFVYAIKSMEKDNAGRIWMCTESGLLRYDSGKFELIPVLDEEGEQYRLDLVEIRDETIWIVANNNVLKSI
jgi:ligand-binding sensor domain-containing protein